MSIATVLSEGLGSFGNIATILGEGLSAYTGLPQPPPAGYQYTTCTSTSFTGASLEQGSSPAVAVGDVFIAQTRTTPSNYLVQVNGNGTFQVFAGGNGSRQSFLYSVYRVASNTIDGPARIWVNEIAPVWNSGINLPTSQYSPILVGTAITPINLASAGYAASPLGDALVFSLATGSLPPGLTLSSAGVLSGTPTAVGSFPFTINATDSANVSVPSPASQLVVTFLQPGTTVIGSQADILNRLQQLMPHGWFQNGLSPLRDGLLTGIANMLASVFSLLVYVRLQSRIATATDGFLDMIAADFFGTSLQRRLNQSDVSYRTVIKRQMFQQKSTRQAISGILTTVTGIAPLIIEPGRAADTGAYTIGNVAYNTAGCYASLNVPYQSFVTAYRPRPGTAQFGLADSDIYAAVESVRMGGTIIWLRILSAP